MDRVFLEKIYVSSEKIAQLITETMRVLKREYIVSPSTTILLLSRLVENIDLEFLEILTVLENRHFERIKLKETNEQALSEQCLEEILFHLDQ